MNLIDTTGAGELIELFEGLREKEVRLSLARVRDALRERMRRTGVESVVGEDRIYDTVMDGVKTFKARVSQSS